MPDLLIKASPIHGQGLFAGRDFKKGELITPWNYTKKISREDISSLSQKERLYVSQMDDGTFVIIGEPARYINHSCDANTIAVNGEDIAIRDIKKGEEITADYSKEKSPITFECRCGSKTCKKILRNI